MKLLGVLKKSELIEVTAGFGRRCGLKRLYRASYASFEVVTAGFGRRCGLKLSDKEGHFITAAVTAGFGRRCGLKHSRG